MVILDTDHLSLLHFPESAGAVRIMARLSSMGIQQAITTIIAYEEQTRGWLGKLAGAKDLPQEIEAYRRFNRNLDGFRAVHILDFDALAADEFHRLRQMKIRIGTMDLKIASIVKAKDAPLLSRNLVDFKKVPGLTVEDRTS